MSAEKKGFRFTPAAYPIRLGFEAVDTTAFDDARGAVEQEFNDAGSWKRLRCRNVRRVWGEEAEPLFELEVDHAVEFDWSWEGAEAFRPVKMDEIGLHESWVFDSNLWSGRIIEFDEAKSLLYVLADRPENPPRKGSFLIRPFEFLRTLNEIYNGDAFREPDRKLPEFSRYSEESSEDQTIQRRLKGRLTAAMGDAPFRADNDGQFRNVPNAGLPELHEWWKKSWSILWGPPGTGKTYTTAHQIAAVLGSEPLIDTDDLSDSNLPHERILVVSTTNRAVDAVAVALGNAVKKSEKIFRYLDEARMVRIGKGAKYSTFEKENLLGMLHGTDVGLLARLESLYKVLHRMTDAEERAGLRLEIENVRNEIHEAKRRNFLDAKNSVVVCTAFAALGMIADEDVKADLEQGKTPFTTIFIDEAGLISRTTCAVLSLLASRRVVLVGDSKQLSPISRISRILPPNKAKWVASSGLSHLDDLTRSSDQMDELPENVHFLNTQYRMHPEIGNAVSHYLYDNKLRHADGLEKRPFALHGDLFEPHPRAVWCVLDAEVAELPSIRADRGPGNKSWIRNATERVLDKLFSVPAFAQTNGLFISPFVAQAKKVQQYLAKKNLLDSWAASTVHSQQGQEADIVIFDTVNAGSFGWSRKEWNRMINVGLSRAREMVILLASRDEMEEGYLSPLLATLKPRTVTVRNGNLSWREVDEKRFPIRGCHPDAIKTEALRQMESLPSDTLGRQIAERAVLHPVLSQEQQQLCGYKIDGKPRLVRGVAGSGKTAVLAEWLVRCLNERLAEGTQNRSPFWVVFGNRSLEKLLARTVENAWRKQNGDRPFPIGEVEYLPIWTVLNDLAKEFELPYKKAESYGFRYNYRSMEILDAVGKNSIRPRCDALFLDEAQDMGPNTLKLLFSLVHSTEGGRDIDKPIFIFYDNAQDVYSSGTPKWSELGLDMRGRSTIMKESFRSTRTISEYAINVLYRLKPDELGDDHKELVKEGILVPSRRDGADWWEVRFNQIDGPKPEFVEFTSRSKDFKSPDFYEEEFTALAHELVRLLTVQRVSPRDICILCNNQTKVKPLFEKYVKRLLPRKFDLLLFPMDSKQRSDSSILVETPHSFKGYDAEIVLIPAADSFVGYSDDKRTSKILANPLYVAMTRARGELKMSATKSSGDLSRRICESLRWCLRHLDKPPKIDESDMGTEKEEWESLLSSVAPKHREWLASLHRKHRLRSEPLLTPDGKFLASPLFLIDVKPQTFACFEEPLDETTTTRLAEQGIRTLRLGESPVF